MDKNESASTSRSKHLLYSRHDKSISLANKLILASLASDLKRVALGSQRNSLFVADKFLSEAIKRKSELDYNYLDSYIQKLLNNLELKLSTKDLGKKAEDALLYSTLLQNYVLYK